MQTLNGHLLLEEHVMAVGLPQRICFATAEDPTMPDELPEWPGPLDYWTPPTITEGTIELVYDAQIVSELRNARRAVATRKAVHGPLDGHQGLMRLKVAGLMAMLEGLTHVDLEIWALAGTLLDSSRQVRSRLEIVKVDADHKRIVTQGTVQAHREMATASVKERQLMERVTNAIIRHATKVGVSRSAVRKATTTGATRDLFEDALAEAVKRGAVEVLPGAVKGSIVRLL
jgi:hypothetical protein